MECTSVVAPPTSITMSSPNPSPSTPSARSLAAVYTATGVGISTPPKIVLAFAIPLALIIVSRNSSLIIL
jgi:hypothetical protein